MHYVTNYYPEEWVIVKITGTDPHYRIFGSWRGGFATSDSWRLNSGVVSCTQEEDCYVFHGHSGSTYTCHSNGYGIRSPWNGSVLSDYCSKSQGTMEVVEEIPSNLLEFDWIIK